MTVESSLPAESTSGATTIVGGEIVEHAAADEDAKSSIAAPQEPAEPARDEEPTPDEVAERKRACYRKIVFAILLTAFVVFIVVDSVTNGYVRSGIESFLEWIEDNPVSGFFAFMLVYFIATVLFIPGSILTLGAGFVFANAFGLGPGLLLATLSVFFGASAGAIVAFLMGRYLLRDWVIGLARKYAFFEALDVAFEEKGFRIMFLLRLSPIIPFNVVNFVMGVTSIRFWAYTWAMLGILPGTVLFCFLGASAGSLADSSNNDNRTVTIIVIVVGIAFGLAAIVVTSYYAKAELNKVIAAKQRQQQQQEEAGTTEEEEITSLEEGQVEVIESDAASIAEDNEDLEAQVAR